MPEKSVGNFLAFLYVVAAVSGAAGGCLVAAHHVLRGRSVTGLFIAAYAFVGMVFGLAGTIISVLYLGIELTLEKTILLGLIFGGAGSATLAGMNLSARFIMRRLGIEVDVSVHRIKDKG